EAYVPRWRERAWLRVDRPGAPLPAVEALATWVELPDAASRSMLVRATVAPATGTWPRPTARLRRLAGRFGRIVSGPPSYRVGARHPGTSPVQRNRSRVGEAGRSPALTRSRRSRRGAPTSRNAHRGHSCSSTPSRSAEREAPIVIHHPTGVALDRPRNLGA